jgi:hypothetical protein
MPLLSSSDAVKKEEKQAGLLATQGDQATLPSLGPRKGVSPSPSDDRDAMRRQRISALEPFPPLPSVAKDTCDERRLTKKVDVESRRARARIQFSFAGLPVGFDAHQVEPHHLFETLSLWEHFSVMLAGLLTVTANESAESVTVAATEEGFGAAAHNDEAAVAAVAVGAAPGFESEHEQQHDEPLLPPSLHTPANTPLQGVMCGLPPQAVQASTSLLLLFRAFDLSSIYRDCNADEEGMVFLSDWDEFVAAAIQADVVLVNNKDKNIRWGTMLLVAFEAAAQRKERVAVVGAVGDPKGLRLREVVRFLAWLQGKAATELSRQKTVDLL